MNQLTQAGEKTQSLLKSFLKQFNLGQLSVSKNSGIQNQMVADVRLLCLGDVNTHNKEDYQVSFKLQGEDVEICDYLKEFGLKGGELTIGFGEEFTDELDSVVTAHQQSPDILHNKIKRFLSTITPRLIEAQKEQQIQSIPFVDNTFELYGKTRFKVLSDDGEGHLSIDMLGEYLDQELKLSSHGLLDGLYTGAIKEVVVSNG